MSEAGGLGVLGAGYMTPEAIREAIRQIRRRTSAPFGANLFVTEQAVPDDAQVQAGLERLAPYAAELGLTLAAPAQPGEDVGAQLDVICAERVPFFSFTFGIPPAAAMAALRDAGILTCGTATTVAEAVAVAEAGADMVCAQAAEAGGHRGGFLGDPAEDAVGLVALVPLIRDAVDIPVIAAGGLMDGRGIAAALALGADAAQLGTAFLLSPEAGTSEPYRHAVSTAAETDTMLTSAFSGRPARGIRNRMASELAGTELPPYPLTNAITRGLRRRAAEAGLSDYLSLWAGQGVPLARPVPAAALIDRLERDTTETLQRLTAMAPAPGTLLAAHGAARSQGRHGHERRGIGHEHRGTEAVPAQMPSRSSSRS